jgi:hypothetical protein
LLKEYAMPRHSRATEINRRQQRRQKLKKLRQRYAKAKTEGERINVLNKLRLVSPTATKEAFLAAIPPPKARPEKAKGARGA